MSPGVKSPYERKFDNVDSAHAVNGATTVTCVENVNSVHSVTEPCVNGDSPQVKVNGENGHLDLVEHFVATGNPEKVGTIMMSVT